MSSARPSLVPRTVDFSASWADVHKCTVEILVNPLQPPSIHMVTLNQKLYFLANGPCMNLPPESQGLISTDGSPSARAPLIIYHLLTKTFTTHLESVVAPLAPLSGTTLLTAYADAWCKYCISLTTLSAVYSYLLTMWKTAGKLNDARQIGERAWREVVFQQVKDPLIKASVDYFTFLREGVPGNARLLRTVVESHVRMADPSHQKPYHLYQSHLEASYLRNADTYLRGLVQPLQGETLVARLCRVVAALKQELKNVEVYLHSSTTKPLTKLIASAVLGEHATAFMMEFSEWIETHERRETELSALYWLISRDDNCLRALGAALTHVIVTLGRRSIETADSPTQFVAAVLNNHRRFTTLFKTVFAKNPVLWPPIRDACVAFTNENALCSSTAVAADYIASFAHLVMKRGVASKSDVDAIIDQYGEGPEVIVTLLALVSDKDVFQARYADLLASRLISGKYNEEAELQLISAVSTAVSRDYCYKWRRMLSDLESSSTLRSSFDEQRNTTEQPSPSFSGLDFRPLVLTQGSWPLQVDARAWVPPATIDAACRAFAQWFNKDRKGVRWVHSVSYGTVLPVYIKARRYEWTVTMAQLLVLNAFNTAPAGNSSVSLGELSRSSNCPADVITKAAQSLVRLKALVFDSPAMANVSLNLEYYASGLKVQMHVVKEQQSASAARVTAKVSPADAPAAPADVNRAMDDRKFAIQTAVVRIAKSRKTITFQDLVSEVIQLLHTAQFKPTIQAVKINIEALIEKEFLERKADDPNILVYVA